MIFTRPQLNNIRIASFDIGKKNFAQYIEDSDVGVLLNLERRYKELPKYQQRRVNGPLNEPISNLLKEVCLRGTRIHVGVYDLRYDKTSDKLDIPTRCNILTHLKKYKPLWDTCDIFVIEQQYFKTWSGRSKKRGSGTEANVDAIKIAEGVLMWFLNEYPLRVIEYFGSQNKTQILGAPWSMTKIQRKKWAEERSRKIYEDRNDKAMVDLFRLRDSIFRKRIDTDEKIKKYIDTYPTTFPEDCCALAEKVVRNRQKLDDISDACVQCQAFKFRKMVACF